MWSGQVRRALRALMVVVANILWGERRQGRMRATGIARRRRRGMYSPRAERSRVKMTTSNSSEVIEDRGKGRQDI